MVGSVPDGWWRDRHGAAERLRDRLAPLAAHGLAAGAGDAPGWASGQPVRLVLVVEGAARGVASVPDVRVESAPGSGDDWIVGVVADAVGSDPGTPCLVVTADRELRRRVAALGAVCAGPRTVLRP